MKKIVCTAVSALALAAFADGVNSTEFGVLHVPSSVTNTIVGVPWLASGTGSDPVKVKDLVLTAGLKDGDVLEFYDAQSGAYTSTWTLQGGVWVGNAIVTDEEVIQTGNDETGIARGTALSLKRGVVTPYTKEELEKGFYIMGKPTTETGSTTFTLPKTAGSKAFTLIALPFATDTSPNDSKLTWNNINGQFDSLTVQKENGDSVTLGYKNSTGKWRQWKDNKWVDPDNMKAGIGAWFITSTNEPAKSVSWK